MILQYKQLSFRYVTVRTIRFIKNNSVGREFCFATLRFILYKSWFNWSAI